MMYNKQLIVLLIMAILDKLKMWFLIWIQVFSLVLVFSVWLLPNIFVGWSDLNIYVQICVGTLISTFLIEFVTMQPILRLAIRYNFVEEWFIRRIILSSHYAWRCFITGSPCEGLDYKRKNIEFFYSKVNIWWMVTDHSVAVVLRIFH